MSSEIDAPEAMREMLGPIPGGLAERNQKGYVATVRTKEELERAQKDRAPEIIVLGQLADDLQTASTIATVGKVALGVIVAAVGAGVALSPVTFGASGVAVSAGVTAAAASTGVGVATIICAAAIGITLVIAVFSDYKAVDFKAGFMHLKLNK